jgi:large subunit ribosomal protein L25
LPRNIPNVIEVDLSSFGVGDTLHAGDIALPEGMSLVSSADDTVVTTSIISLLETEEEAAEAGEGPSESAPEAAAEE